MKMFRITYKTITDLDYNTIQDHSHSFWDLEKAFDFWRSIENQMELGNHHITYDIELKGLNVLEKKLLRTKSHISSKEANTTYKNNH